MLLDQDSEWVVRVVLSPAVDLQETPSVVLLGKQAVGGLHVNCAFCHMILNPSAEFGYKCRVCESHNMLHKTTLSYLSVFDHVIQRSRPDWIRPLMMIATRLEPYLLAWDSADPGLRIQHISFCWQTENRWEKIWGSNLERFESGSGFTMISTCFLFEDVILHDLTIFKPSLWGKPPLSTGNDLTPRPFEMAAGRLCLKGGGAIALTFWKCQQGLFGTEVDVYHLMVDDHIEQIWTWPFLFAWCEWAQSSSLELNPRAQKQVDEGKTALQVEREAGLLSLVCLKNFDTFGEIGELLS